MPKKAVEGGPGKRVPLNMKTTEAVRKRLEDAAAASGRSLTAEVEWRLERSFAWDAAFENIAALQHSAVKAALREAGIRLVRPDARGQKVLLDPDALLNEVAAVPGGFVDPATIQTARAAIKAEDERFAAELREIEDAVELPAPPQDDKAA